MNNLCINVHVIITEIEVYQSYKTQGILSLKALCGTKFSLDIYTYYNVCLQYVIFFHTLCIHHKRQYLRFGSQFYTCPLFLPLKTRSCEWNRDSWLK